MSKKLKLIAIGIAVVIIGSIGFGFYLMMNKISNLETVVQAFIPKEEEAGEEGEEGKKVENMIGQIFPLDSFVVNLSDEKDRFIRVSLSLEYKPDVDAEKIEERLPQIKDAILTYLPSKRSTEIRSIEGKNELRINLLSQINSFYSNDIITNIYFTEFVIQ